MSILNPAPKKFLQQLFFCFQTTRAQLDREEKSKTEGLRRSSKTQMQDTHPSAVIQLKWITSSSFHPSTLHLPFPIFSSVPPPHTHTLCPLWSFILSVQHRHISCLLCQSSSEGYHFISSLRATWIKSHHAFCPMTRLKVLQAKAISCSSWLFSLTSAADSNHFIQRRLFFFYMIHFPMCESVLT